MTDTLSRRIALLQSQRPLLTGLLRGIEKEGLRVDNQGRLAMTQHPPAFGAALTHPRITTDYSESLLELITGTHADTQSLLNELRLTHRHVAAALNDTGELIWNHSMPGTLPPESEIPIAWYGTSNSGMLKHVYRRGLALRYGRTMQCIAGVHYNFSLPEALWEQLDLPGETASERRSAGYIALIRNFTRYSWLLMYLFGASPAVARDFLRDDPRGLHQLDADTLFLPYATSLRMSDLGYQNPAQAQLTLCYNDLNTFLARLSDAVTRPWPEYERIGTHRDGQWIQLNPYLLQIENEYYSTVRPKRVTRRGERPIRALAERGVQYIEARCLDIDPFEPVGIAAETARFMDVFLLYCALQDSPPFHPDGHCPHSHDNFARVVREGRAPGLTLDRTGTPISLTQWGHELIADMTGCAELLDAAYGDNAYTQAVRIQGGKLADPDSTPSGRMLALLRTRGLTHRDALLELSAAHARTLCAEPLSDTEQGTYADLARRSLADQVDLETSDAIPFDEYVARYHAALEALR